MLFQADLREQPIAEVVQAEAQRAVSEPDRQASWLYAREIVDGVESNQAEINETIETYAQGWTLERMPLVDRAILRIAVWEILFNAEVPAPVAISEALALAQTLSTEGSAGFINGVLASVADQA